MKCSKCGKEFGEGVNCQYCGVDRVTGLANYGGYDTLAGNLNGQRINTSPNGSSSDNGGNSCPKTMVCYACNEIIPADSLFCPYCRKKLWVKCPNCGHEYSSQYPNCNKCGTNLNQYLKDREEEKRIKKAEEEKKKAEEEAKKAKEEAEMKIKSDAIDLEASLNPQGTFFVWSMTLLIVSIILFAFLYKYFPDIGLLWFFTCLVPGAVSPFIAIAIGFIVGESRLKKWKQEHPNDPRRKYL